MSTPATLTGLAIGDALGMPFETHHFSSRQLMQWDGSFQASSHHKLKPGQWTDDTQMAVVLAESLLACGEYVPSDAAKRYLELYTSRRIRGIGSTTRTALENMQAGKTNPGILGAEGNGTAMRAAPIGLWYRMDPAQAAVAAELDATLTHDSNEARQGSVAVAVAVALLARGCVRADLIDKVLPWVGTSLVRERIQQVSDRLDKMSVAHVLNNMGTAGHVVQTVPAAFAAFCGTYNLADAVRTAIRAGGDTDTTAAITGALAGTFYGVDQVTPFLGDLEDGARLRVLETRLAV